MDVRGYVRATVKGNDPGGGMTLTLAFETEAGVSLIVMEDEEVNPGDSLRFGPVTVGLTISEATAVKVETQTPPKTPTPAPSPPPSVPPVKPPGKPAGK